MTTTQIDHDPANGCPKCGGALWDNTITKKNPKAPDYKCRDKACDGVIWPPKGGRTAVGAAAPASTAKQPFSSGGRLPWEGEASEVAPVNVSRLDGVLNLHDVCVDHAISVTAKKLRDAGIIPTASDILAAAATQMIGAQKVGAAA